MTYSMSVFLKTLGQGFWVIEIIGTRVLEGDFRLILQSFLLEKYVKHPPKSPSKWE